MQNIRVIAEAKIGDNPIVLTADANAHESQRYSVGHRVYGRTTHDSLNAVNLEDALMDFAEMVAEAELESAQVVA